VLNKYKEFKMVVEVSKTVSKGAKPQVKMEVSRGVGRRPRRKGRLVCPVFRGARR
jgi:hypothetical protein